MALMSGREKNVVFEERDEDRSSLIKLFLLKKAFALEVLGVEFVFVAVVVAAAGEVTHDTTRLLIDCEWGGGDSERREIRCYSRSLPLTVAVPEMQ